jgi:hypothetical protein
MQFTITDYSALHTTTRESFTQAAIVAQGYAAVGGLPATIVDTHVCRWVVWPGSAPRLESCPAEDNRAKAFAEGMSVPGCDCQLIYSDAWLYGGDDDDDYDDNA